MGGEGVEWVASKPYLEKPKPFEADWPYNVQKEYKLLNSINS